VSYCEVAFATAILVNTWVPYVFIIPAVCISGSRKLRLSQTNPNGDITAEIDKQIFFLNALLKKDVTVSSFLDDIEDEIKKGKIMEDIGIFFGNYGVIDQSIDFCTTKFFKKIVETMNKYYDEKEILYKKFRKNKLEKDYNNISDNNEIID
jgi:hypothetical protein